MKVYVGDYPSHAGKWIYKGYQRAWQELGYEVVEYPANKAAIEVVKNYDEDYILMMIGDGVGRADQKMIEKSYKTFIFVQPNSFPLPWGTHSNFQCLCPDSVIDMLNGLDNVYLWCFGDNVSYHNKWKKVNTVPLAYDSISYKPAQDKKYEYDICFVGGWANNGFNEKRKIMLKCFKEFMNSDLRCGIFINRGISHEQENKILYNSKVTINIHDAYQRTLGFDTNERTFKSLGLNGILISDKVGQLERMFPDIKTSNTPTELIEFTKEYLSLTEKELGDIKEENRQNILDNHCYTHRVQQLLSL
jgi:spore maturation protein CgeB